MSLPNNIILNGVEYHRKMHSTSKEMITIKEAAKLLNVNERTISRRIASGKIPSIILSSGEREIHRVPLAFIEELLLNPTIL